MKKEIKFDHAVIGIGTDDQIYTLDSVFEYHPDFRGATGSCFTAYSADYVAEHSTFDAYKAMLEDSGSFEECEITDDLVMRVMSESEFAYQDNSYSYHHDKIKEQAGINESDTLSYTSGGRCFSHDIKWAKIINQELLDLILSYEKEELK